MGKTDPVTQAETLRQLTREANAAIKDLHAAEKTLRDTIDEAHRTTPTLIDQYLADAIADRLAKFDATLTTLADTAAGHAEAFLDELGRLRDATARLTPPPDSKPGAFDCPRCGAHLNAHQEIGRLDEPGIAGGFTACAYCGQVIILTASGPRRPTPAEDAAVRRTEVFRGIEALRSALLADGPGGLEKTRGLIERGSLGTPGAAALRSRVSDAEAARVVAMSKQTGTGRRALGATDPGTQGGTP